MSVKKNYKGTIKKSNYKQWKKYPITIWNNIHEENKNTKLSLMGYKYTYI